MEELMIRSLEEEWEYVKECERKGIDPYKSDDTFMCSDCSKCISVCRKRANEELTIKNRDFIAEVKHERRRKKTARSLACEVLQTH